MQSLSDAKWGRIASRDWTTQKIFPWVIMAPLGNPVVPDVYTMVARSSTVTSWDSFSKRTDLRRIFSVRVP